MYIFSSGGDEKDNYGVAMYYRYGRFLLTVSSPRQEWTVLTDKILVNVSVNVQYTWSIQFGLSLYLDGIKVASTARPLSRAVAARSTYSFYLGRSTRSSSTVYAAIVIEGWKVVYACKEIDDAVLDPTSTTVTATTTASASTGMSTASGSTTNITSSTRAAPSDTSTFTGKCCQRHLILLLNNQWPIKSWWHVLYVYMCVNTHVCMCQGERT